MATLRVLVEADEAAIQSVRTAADDYYILESGVPAEQETALIENAGNCVYYGYFDDTQRLSGFVDILFGYPEERDVHIGLMIFRPEDRRKGYGSTLLGYIEGQARDFGAERLLVAPIGENTTGIEFWTRRGFRLLRVVNEKAYGENVHTVYQLYKLL